MLRPNCRTPRPGLVGMRSRRAVIRKSGSTARRDQQAARESGDRHRRVHRPHRGSGKRRSAGAGQRLPHEDERRVHGRAPDKGTDVTQEVKKDTVLFEIDDRPYQAALAKAKSDVLLAEARFKQADADVKHNEPLVKTRATPKADFDKLVADRDVASAQIASYQATIEAQQLNVDFCKVKAPVDGRVSRAYVTVGNLVAADQTLLTTMVSQDPMYVYFDIDARTMLLIQERIRSGKFKSARHNRDVVVRIGLENEPGRFPHEAAIDLVDNRVDPGTSTLRVRGVLKNPVVTNEERIFSPGLFVRVQVPLGEADEVAFGQ